MGFTAVSIGAQSFHDEVLHRLRRPHDAAPRAPPSSPPWAGSTWWTWTSSSTSSSTTDLAGAFLRDLTDCFELGVDQVSTYPLMRFGYTPFGSTRHDRRREHEVLAEATRIAADHGYERRSVWTFNRRDSATYTSITRRRFLGMGAGASSFLGQDFLVNHFGVRTYTDAVDSGRLPVARWLHLGPLGGTALRRVLAGLRRTDLAPGAGRGAPGRIRGLDLALAPMVGAGLVRRIGNGHTAGFALTPQGFDRYHDLERTVTYRLIEPLWGQMLEEHAGDGAAAPGPRRTDAGAVRPGRWPAGCSSAHSPPETVERLDRGAQAGARRSWPRRGRPAGPRRTTGTVPRRTGTRTAGTGRRPRCSGRTSTAGRPPR